jgi:hypothetical protein
MIDFQAHALASVYMQGTDYPLSDSEIASLRQFIDSELRSIYCPIIYVNYDVTLPECMELFYKENKLYISTANNSHPFLSDKENAHFRAVHDWHHIRADVGSTLGGEIESFKYACITAPESIHWILFSEIVLQAAAAIATGEFQQQKIVKVGGF